MKGRLPWNDAENDPHQEDPLDPEDQMFKAIVCIWRQDRRSRQPVAERGSLLRPTPGCWSALNRFPEVLELPLKRIERYRHKRLSAH